jgi:hypothetical protein
MNQISTCWWGGGLEEGVLYEFRIGELSMSAGLWMSLSTKGSCCKTGQGALGFIELSMSQCHDRIEGLRRRWKGGDKGC